MQLKSWLRFLWRNEDGFFGIGMGPSSAEIQQYGDTGALANFATTQGESAISSANDFWKSILSGDPSQISKVLGPAMSSANKRGQQEKMTMAEFGNRGGGTNATAQNIDTNTRTSIDSMVSGLTMRSADALGASGSSLLATGLSGHDVAFSQANTIQQQHQAKLLDIFHTIGTIAQMAGKAFGPVGSAVGSKANEVLSEDQSSGGGDSGGGGGMGGGMDFSDFGSMGGGGMGGGMGGGGGAAA